MSWSSGSWDDPGAGTGDPGQQATSRREEVRLAVVELARSRRALVDDEERLDGYLRDVCPLHPAEVAVIVVAARSGVPDDLAHATEGHAVEATMARLAGRLHNEAGVDRGLAQWAVETWAIALGRASARAPDVAISASATAAQVGPAAQHAPLAPPAPPGPAAARTDQEALRALVAPPVPGPLHSDPPEPVVARGGRPAPVVNQPTRLPPAPTPPPPRTRSRPSPVAPPAPTPPVPPRPAATKRRPQVLAVVGGVVVLALLAALVALRRGGGDTQTATAGPAAATTSATPATTTTTPAPPRQFPSGLVALDPGTYATSIFHPRMTVTVGGSWGIRDAETSDFLAIGPANGQGQAINFVRLTNVFSPSVMTLAVGDIKPGVVENRHDDTVGWLTANQRLAVSALTPVKVPGASGVQVEVTTRSAYVADGLCREACVPLWVFENTFVGAVFPGNRNLVDVLDVEGEKLLVVVTAPADRYDAFLPEAQRVLATLSFAR